MKLHIDVQGRPAPQGSKSLGAAGQLREQSAYLPAWRAAVKAGVYRAYAAAGILPTQLPLFPAGTGVAVEKCIFFLTPEQSPLGPPDIDKLLRSTLDALGGAKAGGARVFADDAQVYRIDHLAKLPTRLGGNPGALIILSDEG